MHINVYSYVDDDEKREFSEQLLKRMPLPDIIIDQLRNTTEVRIESKKQH